MSENTIIGDPTKQFFIEMITRDISVEDAIVDLIDNSIDGASRFGNSDYKEFEISLTINKDCFSISDNCGGFSLTTAKQYAFRFGRPSEIPQTENSIGRFGIGMKRALFKIGKSFEIETQHEEEHFSVNVDVDVWKDKKQEVLLADGTSISVEDWSFPYKNIDGEKNSFDGTTIKVSNLKPEVSRLFAQDSFIRALMDTIRKMLVFSLNKGMKISVNGTPLSASKIELLFSEESKPFYYEEDLGDVHCRIVAGLGKIGEPKESGWYVFCNNRLVLEADQSSLTGWGVNSMVKWHINYVMFRGLVFLDSKETKNLPLTTTKKGIDGTSPVFQKIMPIMRRAMIAIKEFLVEITKMGDEANAYRQMLCENYKSLPAVEWYKYPFEGRSQNTFLAPPLDMEKISYNKENVRISYAVPKKLAENAKNVADVKSFKELGETSFNYYVKMEDISNE